MDNHSSWSCSSFAQEEKAALIQPDGTPEGVLSGAVAVKVTLSTQLFAEAAAVSIAAGAPFGLADDGSL